MKINTLTLACLAASLSLAGCGGGGGSSSGSTVSDRGQIDSAYKLACIDHNHNFQCDDGDTQKAVSNGETGLTPASDEFVLLEGRDSSNQRNALLISVLGSASVSGLSTLQTLAGNAWSSELAATFAGQNTLLETRFADAVQSQPLALPALYQLSQAIISQADANAEASNAGFSLGEAEALVNWESSNANDNRQLTAFGSRVLSNTESNRLYLFDSSTPSIEASQLDLLPVLETVASNVQQQLIKPLLFALDQVLDVLIDTASAASSLTGEPSTEVPVTYEPGTGISAVQLVANGSQAYVLMNTASDDYSSDDCLSKGSEGIFKIDLSSAGSTRELAESTLCAHSGFTLLAADLSGANLVAWEASSQRLWLLNSSLQKQKLINTGVSNAQALAISPGGQFAALASYGQLAIIDLVQGRNVANLAGNWTNASQVSFSAGLGKVVVTSGKEIHSISLDTAMQWLAATSTSVGADILTLSSASDGESYVVSTADKLYWYASKTNQQLAQQSVPAKLAVKRTTLANNQLILLGQQLADDRYALFRLPLSLPSWPN